MTYLPLMTKHLSRLPCALFSHCPPNVTEHCSTKQKTLKTKTTTFSLHYK